MSVNILISNNFNNITKSIVPWYDNTLIDYFTKELNDNVLIVSRNTAKKLPRLENTTIYCVSKKLNFYGNKILCVNNNVLYFRNLLSAIKFGNIHFAYTKKIYIGGGVFTYNTAFTDKNILIDNIHVLLNKNDTSMFYSFMNINNYICNDLVESDTYYYYTLFNKYTQEKLYLNLLSKVLISGIEKKGRNGITKSVFNPSNLVFTELYKRFPLITTKKMFIRGIIEELLFFIRGDTDSSKLEEKGVKIWKGNTSREFLDSIGKHEYKEGEMGPMYGYQWRNFNGSGLDQLNDIINKIKSDPESRRLLMTTYNPLQANEGVLYPCHSIIMQFYIRDNMLDLFVYNRSSDLFLGLPFNITMSSLLLIIISKATNKIPGTLTIGLGDSHIYESHYDSVKKQLFRIPYDFPTMNINKEINSIEDIEKLSYEDFILSNYNSYSSIKAEMVV
jgi:thymidylate synthase